jgi:succinate dehydrogenase / fumarate reductase cytochrome b subunit
MSATSTLAPSSTLPLPRTTVGAKLLVAVTGLALMGFVLAHMLGNLQIFLGQEALNAYGHFLQSNLELLWPARIGLLTVFVVHVALAVKLRLATQQARTSPYVFDRTIVTSRAARYMLVSGLLVLAFVLYHLAHFTLGWTQTATVVEPASGKLVTMGLRDLRDVNGHHDVYSMVVLGFQNPLISGLYIVAQLLLASHLYHGASSVFQTLGVNNYRVNKILRWVGPVLATVVAVGNISIPVAVLSGLISLPTGG